MAAPKIFKNRNKIISLVDVKEEIYNQAKTISEKHNLPFKKVEIALNTLLLADISITGDNLTSGLVFLAPIEKLIEYSADKEVCLDFIISETQTGLVELSEAINLVKKFTPLNRKEILLILKGVIKLHSDNHKLIQCGYWCDNDKDLPGSFLAGGFNYLLPTKINNNGIITRSNYFDSERYNQQISQIETNRGTLYQVRIDVLTYLSNCAEQNINPEINSFIEILLKHFNPSQLRNQSELELEFSNIAEGIFPFYYGGLNWITDIFMNYHILLSDSFQKIIDNRPAEFSFNPLSFNVDVQIPYSENSYEIIFKSLSEDYFENLYIFLNSYADYDFSKKLSDFQESFTQMLDQKDPIQDFTKKAFNYANVYSDIYNDVPSFPKFCENEPKNDLPKSFVTSSDYREITYKNISYHLSKNQASVVRYLVEQYKLGIKEINYKKITEQIDVFEERIEKVFKVTISGAKETHPAWNVFIGPGSKRGTIRLIF